MPVRSERGGSRAGKPGTAHTWSRAALLALCASAALLMASSTSGQDAAALGAEEEQDGPRFERVLRPRTVAELARGSLSLSHFGYHVDEHADPRRIHGVAVLSRGPWEPEQLVRIGQCAAFFRALREQDDDRSIGHPDHPLTLDFDRIRSGDRTLYDGVRECLYFERGWTLPAAGDDPPFCECAMEGERCTGDLVAVGVAVLSVVGPLLTTARSHSEAGACGPSYHRTDWQTVDVRTGLAANLLDYVDGASLADALRNDRVMQELHGEVLASAPSAEALLAPLAPRSPPNAPVPFAFYDYDAHRHRVAVRLPFYRGRCGMCTNQPGQIGVWVTPSPELASWLRAARRREGLFLSHPDAPLPLRP